jgi:hypothetical protein
VTNLNDILASSPEDLKKVLSEFTRRLYRPSEDCPEEDCDPIVCECGGCFKTVFGSLPLLLKCEDCEKVVPLSDFLVEL